MMRLVKLNAFSAMAILALLFGATSVWSQNTTSDSDTEDLLARFEVADSGEDVAVSDDIPIAIKDDNGDGDNVVNVDAIFADADLVAETVAVADDQDHSAPVVRPTASDQEAVSVHPSRQLVAQASVVPARTQTELAELKKTNQELKSDLESIRKQRNEAQKQLMKAHGELSNVQNRLTELERETSGKADVTVVRTESRTRELQAEVERLRRERSQLQRKLMESAGRVSAERVKDDPKLTGARQTDMFAALRSESNDLKARIQQLKEQLADRESRIDELESEQVAVRQRLAAVNTRLAEKLQEEEARANREMTDPEKQAVKLRMELEIQTEKVKQLARLVDELKALTRTQGVALKSQHEQIQLLESSVRSLKTENLMAQTRLREAQSKGDDVRGEYQNFKESVAGERVDMHFNLAVVYDINGFHAEAEEEYLKVLKIKPEDADAHYNLGILYDDKLKQKAKAQKHYEKFLELRPTGPDAAYVRQWLIQSKLKNR